MSTRASSARDLDRRQVALGTRRASIRIVRALIALLCAGPMGAVAGRGGHELPLDRHRRELRGGHRHGRHGLGDGDRDRHRLAHREPRPWRPHQHQRDELHDPGRRLGHAAQADHTRRGDRHFGYTIARQFTTLAAWEDCVDGAAGRACPFFPVATASLVADNRSEVGVAYSDSAFTAGLIINGSTTDATHTITLTADGDNRHYGLPGQGVVINMGAAGIAVYVQDDFVTVEWLEITNTTGANNEAIRANNLTAGAGSQVVLRNNLIHNGGACGIGLYDPDGRVDVYDNIVYGNTQCGLWVNPVPLLAGSQFRVLNNTFYGNTTQGILKSAGASAAKTLLVRNNISVNNTGVDFSCDAANALDATSSNNLSDDGTRRTACSPAGGAVTSTVANVAFVNAAGGDFHIGAASTARGAGANLAGLGIFSTDIDAATRVAPWDIGADQFGVAAVGVGCGAGTFPTGTNFVLHGTFDGATRRRLATTSRRPPPGTASTPARGTPGRRSAP